MRRPALILCCALVALPIAGCGGDDGASESDLEEAKKEARAEGRKAERERQELRELRRRTARLERQAAARRRSGGRSSSSRSSGGGGGSNQGRGDVIPGPESSTAATSAGNSCGDGLAVNVNTSCGFARNVRDEYGSNPGASSITTFSPATGRSFTLSCSSSGGRVSCTGGNNARVEFPG